MGARMVRKKFPVGQNYIKNHKVNHPPVNRHWHDCYELEIVLAGSGITLCNGRQYVVQRGMISLLSPMDLHEFTDCSQLELLNIQFSGGDIDNELLKHFSDAEENVAYADESTLAQMQSLFQMLGQLGEPAHNAMYDKRLLECMIIAFLKNCSAAPHNAIESQAIQRVVNYVNAHFCENPKMSDVAQKFHFSQGYFCRLFKQCVGVSYKNYVKKLKLEYSYKLIKNTDLSITEIAANCGYETQSHFNREFKNHFLAPPTAFREE